METVPEEDRGLFPSFLCTMPLKVVSRLISSEKGDLRHLHASPLVFAIILFFSVLVIILFLRRIHESDFISIT